MASQERRLAPRYVVHCQGALIDLNTQRRQTVSLCDLSEGGAAIVCDDLIIDDGRYLLEFTIPGREAIRIHADCEVARLGLAPGQRDFAAGLRFVSNVHQEAPAFGLFLGRLGRVTH